VEMNPGESSQAAPHLPDGAVLSKGTLKRRLRGDLIISPILDESQIGEGSVDISLGTRFIRSRRSKMTEIDFPGLTRDDIHSFQESVVAPFDGQYILHPRGFVLGCTFEFIALPTDICAFILSRSSYGRAGLLIATATFVHPGWRGCLTLELENLGEIPIILRPLSTVGQLVLLSASKLPEQPPAKLIPVGPMFTTLNEDPRWEKIQALSSREGTVVAETRKPR
jgi:dCTP deaminase